MLRFFAVDSQINRALGLSENLKRRQARGRADVPAAGINF
jgi:hypothetical protein